MPASHPRRWLRFGCPLHNRAVVGGSPPRMTPNAAVAAAGPFLKRFAGGPEPALSRGGASGKPFETVPSPVKVGKGDRQLLHLDLSARIFELLSDLGGVILGDAFLDSLATGLDEVLGFLETKARDGADFLDDVDLFVAA